MNDDDEIIFVNVNHIKNDEAFGWSYSSHSIISNYQFTIRKIIINFTAIEAKINLFCWVINGFWIWRIIISCSRCKLDLYFH